MTISGARRSVRLRCQLEADPEQIAEYRLDLGVGVELPLLSAVGPGADQTIATERDATGLVGREQTVLRVKCDSGDVW